MELVNVAARPWNPVVLISANRLRETSSAQCRVRQLGTALSFPDGLNAIGSKGGKVFPHEVEKYSFIFRVIERPLIFDYLRWTLFQSL